MPPLPRELFELLSEIPHWPFSCESPWNLHRLVKASGSTSSGDKPLARTSVQALLWGWERYPLDERFLLPLLSIGGSRAPNSGYPFILANLYARPSGEALRNEEELWTIACGPPESPDADQALHFSLERINGPFGLFRLHCGFEFFMRIGHYDHASALLDAFPRTTETIPLLKRLRAEAALHFAAPEAALPIVESVDDHIFGFWKEYALAGIALSLGSSDRAGQIISGLWQHLPWNSNLLLTAHDLLHPLQTASPDKSNSRVAVLLYSWNKADLLRQTLEYLRKSRTADSPVFVLDNGSTDGTGAMLRNMQADWPGGFEVVSLPVNIGAPGARNWLLSIPEVQACDWAAFLDDDIQPPEDWLEQLLSTAHAYPETGAVGCCVVDSLQPHALQCADFQLIPPNTHSNFSNHRELINIFNPGIGQRDTLLFNYTRPCVHVSGCCHLVNMDAVRESGSFDIRLTPSQFDDLERDMRSFLKGRTAVYRGQLRIPHIQHSSLKQAASPEKTAQVMGNKIKLEHLHPPEAIKSLVENGRRLALSDLARKAQIMNNMSG